MSATLVPVKIDRLLAIIMCLLNHDRLCARELARRFGVTVRTIQRDMQTLELAGIPIYAVQGPGGGYGIMDSYKLDRQLITVDDFYRIITALESVGASISDQTFGETLEKIRALLPDRSMDLLAERSEKLSIDFTMLGGDPRRGDLFRLVRRAVEEERPLRFSYTSNKLESSLRVIEPLTIAFRWRSWYLYGYCRLREDYRLFKISRIVDPEILSPRFVRKKKTLAAFLGEVQGDTPPGSVKLSLKFSPPLRPVVEECYDCDQVEFLPDGTSLVTLCMPEDRWLYGYLLSFGPHLEVLEPEHIRTIIRESAEQVAARYR
nr:YafY family protein [Alkalispirochaeta alkalica]